MVRFASFMKKACTPQASITISDSRNQPSTLPSPNPSAEKSNNGSASNASTMPVAPTMLVRSPSSI